MERKLNVLVLGVGGNVSQGILKALALSSLDLRVVTACISPYAPGFFQVGEKAYVSPLAADAKFIPWLVDVCRTERIDAVLSGAEPNLNVMAKHAEGIHKETGAVCIVSSPQTLAIGDDKLETCKWLKQNGFNYPLHAPCSDKEAARLLVEQCGYPLIAKPRVSRGGVRILKVENEAGLNYALSFPDFVLEECLGTDETEYTVGCFCDKDGNLRGTIAMHRELQQGTTCRAEVAPFPEVSEEAARIVRALKPLGPANVQLRVSNDRPVCFEINIRFSGTTPIRAKLGWNDVEMALRHFVLGEPGSDLPVISSGTVLRYWDELYIDSRSAAELRTTGSIEDPQRYVKDPADARISAARSD